MKEGIYTFFFISTGMVICSIIVRVCEIERQGLGLPFTKHSYVYHRPFELLSNLGKYKE